MSPMRPYLLRAIYDWIIDNELTPHILVNAEYEDAQVPQQYVKDGQIILNIDPTAVQDFDIDDDEVNFNTRFSGEKFAVFVPMGAVLGIFAKENANAGMFFQPEPAYEAAIKPVKPSSTDKPSPKNPTRPTKPVLKLVK